MPHTPTEPHRRAQSRGPEATVPAPQLATLSAPLADALFRALTCPDLFLIDADPHDRATLVEALIIASPHQRVLVLTTDLEFANHLAEEQGDRVLRAMGPDDDVPPTLADHTLAARLRTYQRERDRERGQLEKAQAACTAIDASVTRLMKLRRSRAELVARRDNLAAEVEGDPSLQTRLARLTADHESARVPLEAQGNSLAARGQELARTLAEMEPEPSSGILTRLLHRRQIADRERARAEIFRQIEAVRAEETQVQDLCQSMLKEQSEERNRIIAAEVARRHDEIEGQIADLDREDQALVAAVQQSSDFLTGTGLFSGNGASSASRGEFPELESLQHECLLRRLDVEGKLAAIEADAKHPARGLLQSVTAVIGPPQCVGFDRGLEDADFDLLVLDGATEINEAWLTTLMKLARRQVLLGRSPAQEAMNLPSLGRSGVRSRFSKGDAVALDVFTRLTGRLDQEPWRLEGERLVRRLVPLVNRDPQALRCEAVLDRPEVELRFDTDDAGQPILAEIAFPATMSAFEAKAFLFATLGEVVLRPIGECHTHDNADSVVVCWPAIDRPDSDAVWLNLHPGIREKVIGDGAHAYTAAVAFDRTIGWNAESAEAWLADHYPSANPSRVAVLPRAELVAV